MHKKMIVVAAAVLALCLSSAQADDTKTYKGWVSDASCGAEHVGGKNAGCVRKCVKGGAHVGHPEWTAQAMVLVLDETNDIVVISNPEKLAGHEAEHVTVTAKVAEDKSIEVLEFTAEPNKTE
jgi:hypothetical protein